SPHLLILADANSSAIGRIRFSLPTLLQRVTKPVVHVLIRRAGPNRSLECLSCLRPAFHLFVCQAQAKVPAGTRPSDLNCIFDRGNLLPSLHLSSENLGQTLVMFGNTPLS